MKRASTLGLAVLVAGLALCGCTSRRAPVASESTTHMNQPGSSPSQVQVARGNLTGVGKPPASSPLASCVAAHPTGIKPIDTDLAGRFVDDRVISAFTLDGGKFTAAPASSTVSPRIGASQAFCNLLASGTSFTEPLVYADGVSFGLAVVTVADSVLKPGPHAPEFSTERTVTLQPYHAQLAWIAVRTTGYGGGCMGPPPDKPSSPAVPGYQIVVIDANTGANGIVYSATANKPCHQPGYSAPTVNPAYELVSLPWRMISRGPGLKSATISYEKRSCDLANFGEFEGTGRPVVLAAETHPAVVAVAVNRVLVTCGPPVATSLLLRSATLATNLPKLLTHAVLGAMDTVEQ